MIRIIRQAISHRKAILAEGGIVFFILVPAMIYFFLSEAFQPF